MWVRKYIIFSVFITISGLLLFFQACSGDGLRSHQLALESTASGTRDVNLNEGDGTVKLSWDVNTESDLAGYKVYMRSEADQYGQPISVIDNPVTVNDRVIFEVSGLDQQKVHYFVVSAYDLSGNESEFSGEVKK